jgi:hypothetical protein
MQWRGGGQNGKRNAGTDGYEDMDAMAMGNRSKIASRQRNLLRLEVAQPEQMINGLIHGSHTMRQ